MCDAIYVDLFDEEIINRPVEIQHAFIYLGLNIYEL